MRPRTAHTARPAPVVGTTSTTSAALSTTTTTASSAVTRPIANGVNGINATMTRPATVQVSTASAVMRVTTARCDHEAACNNVGTGRAYGDRDSCVNEIGHDIVAAFPNDECASGIDAERLATCISELQAKPCGSGEGEGEGEGEGAPSETPASCARERLCIQSRE